VHRPEDGTTLAQPPTRAATRAEALAVPYLGPDPLPSQRWGRAFAAVAAVDVALRLLIAQAYVQRAHLDDRLASQHALLHPPFGGPLPLPANSAAALKADLASNTDRMHALGRPELVVWAVALALVVAWTRARRPKGRLASHGETHVETHPGLVGPDWSVKLALVLAAFGIVLRLFGRVSATTPLDELASHRWMVAGAQLAWAGFFVVFVLRVRWSEQAHRARLAGSTAARSGAIPVAYVAPVEHLPNLAEEGAAGGAWIFVTFAKVVVVAIGTFAAIGLIGHALDPANHQALPSWLGGIACAVATVAFLFRRRLRAAVRPAPPAADAAVDPA